MFQLPLCVVLCKFESSLSSHLVHVDTVPVNMTCLDAMSSVYQQNEGVKL